MRTIVATIVLLFVFTASLASVASAQGSQSVSVLDAVKASACSISTKGMEKAARELVELSCEADKAELRAKIAKANREVAADDLVLTKRAARTVESDSTTSTVKRVDGRLVEEVTTTSAYSATPKGARHDERMAEATQQVVGNGFGYYGVPSAGNFMGTPVWRYGTVNRSYPQASGSYLGK